MRIIVAGDFCPKDRVAEHIEQSNYRDVFKSIKELTEKVDYSILNLECPIVVRPSSPIEKCGPNLKCSDKVIGCLKYMGFDCVTLANNHFLDYGESGVIDTLEALRSNKIDYVGGGKCLKEASKILYIERNGQKVAVINCCEHEFSIATETSSGSNPLNAIQQYYAITEAKDKADFVVVIVHGGWEHFQYPSIRMQEIYRFFVDSADVVINHHQHCFSGYEVYKNKPIFYGLGNFCFDWNGKRDSIWNEGYVVELNLGEGITYKIHPYIQCDNEPNITFLLDDTKFKEKLQAINKVINDKESLRSVIDNYLEKEYKNYVFCFEPFYNKYTNKLFWRGKIPSFIERRRSALIDYIGNESHYEKVMTAIEKTRKSK